MPRRDQATAHCVMVQLDAPHVQRGQVAPLTGLRAHRVQELAHQHRLRLLQMGVAVQVERHMLVIECDVVSSPVERTAQRRNVGGSLTILPCRRASAK
eukprot:scaffold49879_cov62-Phaeocystis_antarctica.AAC.2